MIVIMLGAPGTGKGTVAGLLTKKWEIPQVSTGDIFRKHIKEQTELGKLANEYISKGKLVPDDVTIKLIESKFKEDETKNGIILDGFPRTINQAESLDKILKDLGKEVTVAINLETSEEELINRIVNRRVCKECKSIYNLKTKPPKQESICDNCGGELMQRPDDNEEVFKERLATYSEQTRPLVEYYEQHNKLLNIETTRKTPSDIVEEIDRRIKI